MPRPHPDPQAIGFGPRFTVAVSVGSLLNPINSSVIAVALVTIGDAFGVGPGSTAWLVSALYLTTAVGQPTMGKLADQFGARRIYLAGMGLTLAGGLLGYWAPSWSALVASRVVIGLGTSAAYPAAMAMVRRQAQRLGRAAPGSVLGALAVAGQVSMAAGPPLGGLLIAFGGWRTIFLVNVPLAIAGAAFAVRWLPRDEARGTRPSLRSIDPVGLALFAVGLISLLLFGMRMTAPQWPLLALAVGALSVLVYWELRQEQPFLDVRMLARNRALSATFLRYALTFLVTYGFIYGWTQWLEQSAGRSVVVAGLLLAPSFVVGAVVSALAARTSRVWALLVGGALALVAGSVGLLVLRHDSPVALLVTVSVLLGVQNGLNVVANQAAMYAQTPAEQIGTAAGLLRTFQYLGAMFSATLVSLSYGDRATDGGLHVLAAVLVGVSLCLLAAVLASSRLRARDRTTEAAPTH